jgi:NADPH:quinone reductase-like Zn-dependent oxidoreductase
MCRNLWRAQAKLLFNSRLSVLTRSRHIFAAATTTRRPQLPYTPGSDGAGTIHSTGQDVTEFKIGDRVYTAGSLSGTYAEYALLQNAPSA